VDYEEEVYFLDERDPLLDSQESRQSRFNKPIPPDEEDDEDRDS